MLEYTLALVNSFCTGAHHDLSKPSYQDHGSGLVGRCIEQDSTTIQAGQRYLQDESKLSWK